MLRRAEVLDFRSRERPCLARGILLWMAESKLRGIELLAPAGDMAALKAAVDAGADAVYLGIGELHARRRAGGFLGNELKEAVRFTHLRDAKIYGTLNILVRQNELEKAAEHIYQAYSAGVDALIVQDWAVAKLVRELAPDIRLHASTQLNAHNSKTLSFLEEKGFDRVTLARELTFEDVARMTGEHGIEVEVFAHGALCFSFSGQCLIASMVSGRSGNRGMCPQVCRLPYELRHEDEARRVAGKHIMSTRDLCALTMLEELGDAGVASIKVEGRLKTADYVALVVSVYRRALDAIATGGKVDYEKALEELRASFNRGFTEGYLRGIRDERLMSPGRPSDRGVMIGRVAFLDVYGADVGVTLQRSIEKDDVVEFWVSKGGRIRQVIESLTVEGAPVDIAPAGSRAVIKVGERRHIIRTGDRVFLVERRPAELPEKRIPVMITVSIAEGRPIALKAAAGDAVVEVAGEKPAEAAITKPLSEGDVAARLSKLGGTAYEAAEVEVEIDGSLALPVAEINEARRRMVVALDEARLKRYEKTFTEKRLSDVIGAPPKPKAAREMKLSVKVADEGCARAARDGGADRVYLAVRTPEELAALCDEAIFALGNIATERETTDYVRGLLKLKERGSLHGGEEAKRYESALVLCDNLGLARALKEAGFTPILDYHVNVLNGVATRELATLAPAGITASVEADIEDIATIASWSPVPVEVAAHGHIEVMTAEHPLAKPGGEPSEMEDRSGFVFPVLVDAGGRSHIFNAKELCLLEELPQLAQAGASSIRLLLDLYKPAEVGAVVSIYRRALDELAAMGEIKQALSISKSAHTSFVDHTTGHFYRPVL